MYSVSDMIAIYHICDVAAKIYEGRGSDIARAGSKIIAHCLNQLGLVGRQKNAFSALHFADHCPVSLSDQWRRILCR